MFTARSGDRTGSSGGPRLARERRPEHLAISRAVNVAPAGMATASGREKPWANRQRSRASMDLFVIVHVSPL
jgi:hypothetical protein